MIVFFSNLQVIFGFNSLIKVGQYFFVVFMFLIVSKHSIASGDDVLAEGLTEDEILEFVSYLDSLEDISIADFYDPESPYIKEYSENTDLLKEKGVFNALTEEEKSAFLKYQEGIDATKLNEALIEVKGEFNNLDPELKELYDNLISGLEKENALGFTNSISTYKEYPYVFAAKNYESNFIESNGERAINVGDYVTNDAFMSTTNSKQIYYGFSDEDRPLKLAIKTSGSQPLLETFRASESEVLIKPKHVFKVVAIRENGPTDVRVVMVEQDTNAVEYKDALKTKVKAKDLYSGEERELPNNDTEELKLDEACAY